MNAPDQAPFQNLKRPIIMQGVEGLSRINDPDRDGVVGNVQYLFLD